MVGDRQLLQLTKLCGSTQGTARRTARNRPPRPILSLDHWRIIFRRDVEGPGDYRAGQARRRARARGAS
jgi:hypothetical protein